jgi:hypothetical protein
MTSTRVDATPQAIEADIARQREELVDTVQMLQARLKLRARQVAGAVAAGAGLMAGVIIALKLRRRNS